MKIYKKVCNIINILFIIFSLFYFTFTNTFAVEYYTEEERYEEISTYNQSNITDTLTALELEGLSLINVVNLKDRNYHDGVRTISSKNYESPSWVQDRLQKSSLVKTDTEYTFIYNIIENTTSTPTRLHAGFGNTTQFENCNTDNAHFIKAGEIGLFKFVLRSKSNFENVDNFDMIQFGKGFQGEEHIRYNLVVVEGNFLNESDSFFENLIKLETNQSDNNELNINYVSKNLFDKNNLYDNGVTTFGNYHPHRKGYDINVTPGEFITITYEGSNHYWFADKNKNRISSGVLDNWTSGKPMSATLQIPKDCYYLRIGVLVKEVDEGTNTNLDTFQVVRGKKSEKYTPFVEQISINLKDTLRSINLNDTKDKIIRKNNRWYIERNTTKVVFDGIDENWYLANDSTFRINFTKYKVDSTPDKINHLNNRYIDVPYKNFYTGGPKENNTLTIFTHHISKEQELILKDESFLGNLEKFKESLRENNLIIIAKLKEPIYEKLPNDLDKIFDNNYGYIDIESNSLIKLNIIIDKIESKSAQVLNETEANPTVLNIAKSRSWINQMPELSLKDEMQMRLSNISNVSDMVLNRKSTTSNLDVYIKSENILQMSLDTNSINFDDFSGIEDIEKANAVNITINSSLPYQLNAYLPAEIQNADKTKTLDKSILNIKESSSNSYQTFSNINGKVVLKDNCSSGNQLIHGVDLKLAGGIAHEKDVYKATIKLEVEQK